jgi:bifunctional DNase/RNase
MNRFLLVVLVLLAARAASAENLKVESVEVRMTPMGAAVLLRLGDRAIPVMVDPTVAQSIDGALGGHKPARPLTHDLMHSVLTGFGGKVTQVVVTLHDTVFYGALTVVLRDESRVFDSRSSDAIALAVHARAPIFVSKALLDRAGIELK